MRTSHVGRWGLCVAVLGLLLLVGTAFARGHTHHCRRITWGYGGGPPYSQHITATNLSCRRAKRVIRGWESTPSRPSHFRGMQCRSIRGWQDHEEDECSAGSRSIHWWEVV
jgi:hypothetical protein